MRKRTTLAVAAALVMLGTPAAAFEVKISGQVNRALMGVDDGVKSESFHVDNDNSSTRFRFVGSENIQPGLKAGLVWEVEYQSNPSNLVTMAVRDTPIATTLDERHIDLFFEGRFGKVSFGQGDGAANGAVEVDLSGTTVAHYAGVSDIGGAFAFRTPAGAFGPTIAATTDRQDFESRYDRLRYDTPALGGFKLVGSVGVKDTTRDVKELALWYAGDLGALGKLAGALGYSNEDGIAGGIDDRVIGGSVSWLHGSGFNVTLGRTERDVTASREGTFNYVKLGYKTGKHALSADFGMADDQEAAGDEGQVFGVGYVYAPVAWADLYALLKRHGLDRVGTSFEDINFVMLGTRLKF
ncbi:MAG: porin [Betaproteobacteria bacterium]